MNDRLIARPPAALAPISRDTAAIGFNLASEPRTGALLRALAATKPHGRFLEVGTGTGVGTAWLLDGMDATSTITSIDVDEAVIGIARRHLGRDARVTFAVGDGAAFLRSLPANHFDFIYADAWPGKFTHFDDAFSKLRVGGVYFVDDLLPQPTWPDGHAVRVPALVDLLEREPRAKAVKLAWASGLMLVVRTAI